MAADSADQENSSSPGSDSTGGDGPDRTSATPPESGPDTRDEKSAAEPGSEADDASQLEKDARGTSAAAARAAADSEAPKDLPGAGEATAGEASTPESGDSPDAAESPDADAHRHSPALIATAVALPVVLIVGVLVAAFMVARAPVEHEPLAIGPIRDQPGADTPACAAVLDALPTELGDFTEAELKDPAPPATAAWHAEDPGAEPIVMRCGTARPEQFDKAAALQQVDEVDWFQVRDDVASMATWFTVDREVYIAVTIPDGAGSAPVQQLGRVIAEVLPKQEPDPAPLPE